MITQFKLFEQLQFSEGDYVLINLKKVISECEIG
jgi:hypothetical protein